MKVVWRPGRKTRLRSRAVRRIIFLSNHDTPSQHPTQQPNSPAEATQLRQENGREAAPRPGDLDELRPTACDRVATLGDDGGGGGGYV
ncbi:hypothetical protein S40288_10667 [Stachybotrys chartarum IBT 40288]|nr:hypothetical protein S40288_10667 [Stachybotrys chartarum IBT 40288]